MLCCRTPTPNAMDSSKITEANFSSSLARHNNFLQECTGLFDHSYHILVHDIRLLLLRFAYEKSFSAECGGGGPQSNLYLLPYVMHVAIYVLTRELRERERDLNYKGDVIECRTRCYQREEKNLDTFLSASSDKWVSSSYEVGRKYILL